jgi:ABC-2 type transport system ATP-binding protein
VPCAQLLDRFALAACARRQVGGLSGGTRRRLAVALAFVGRPQAVFLDEPTVGLDLDARRRVWDVIREHAAAGGSVLLTTHQFDEAGALADRVAVLGDGRIVAGGTPADLRAGFGSVSLEEAVVRVLTGAGR